MAWRPLWRCGGGQTAFWLPHHSKRTKMNGMIHCARLRRLLFHQSSRLIAASRPRMLSSVGSPSHAAQNETTRAKRRRLDPAMSTPVVAKITLSPIEETIRKLLVDVAANIDSTSAPLSANNEPVVLRFTGGWVRDKLLGIPSNDIDVGINKMTGFDFANRLTDFLRERQDEYDIPAKGVYKIESNPDKSKHLETATTMILGLSIDFVNLRSETYSGDSRIPQMEFGTPLEDALRRDATVNALFYNLNSQLVEDWTERGLEDIEKKVMRTPLAPYETFADDPLRVLRLIRFSSRLGFDIVEEAKEAMQNPEIKEALRLKISRERIGTEVEKMLQGPNPHLALSQIYSLGLFTSIFAPPTNEPLPSLPISNMSLSSATVLYLTTQLSNPPYTNISNLLSTRQDRFIAWLIAALTPWAGHTLPSGPDTKKKQNIPATATAAREGLKITNKNFDILTHSFGNAESIWKAVEENAETPIGRASLGMRIRTWGADWRNQAICSLVLELVKYWEETTATTTMPSERVHAQLRKCDDFLKRIEELEVGEACSFKSIINGKELSQALGQKSGGWMKTAIDQIIEWQMENPSAGKEEAIGWAKGMKGEWIG